MCISCSQHLFITGLCSYCNRHKYKQTQVSSFLSSSFPFWPTHFNSVRMNEVQLLILYNLIYATEINNTVSAAKLEQSNWNRYVHLVKPRHNLLETILVQQPTYGILNPKYICILAFIVQMDIHFSKPVYIQ